MADPQNTDPAERDPREQDLVRRSGSPAVSPWLVISLVVLVGVAVYVVSAMMG